MYRSHLNITNNSIPIIATVTNKIVLRAGTRIGDPGVPAAISAAANSGISIFVVPYMDSALAMTGPTEKSGQRSVVILTPPRQSLQIWSRPQHGRPQHPNPTISWSLNTQHTTRSTPPRGTRTARRERTPRPTLCTTKPSLGHYFPSTNRTTTTSSTFAPPGHAATSTTTSPHRHNSVRCN